jgi:hypothetical protein
MEINNNSTPLSKGKLSQNSASIKGHSGSMFNSNLFNKYNIILALSVITFIAGAGFWIFVTFLI